MVPTVESPCEWRAHAERKIAGHRRDNGTLSFHGRGVDAGFDEGDGLARAEKEREDSAALWLPSGDDDRLVEWSERVDPGGCQRRPDLGFDARAATVAAAKHR